MSDWLTRMSRMDSTVRTLRRNNRSLTLSALFFNGPSSRADLSRITGLSLTTVGTVVADLIDERLVVGAGQFDATGGRPTALLRVNPRGGYVIGVGVDERAMTAELFDLGMRPLAATKRPPPMSADVIAAVSGQLPGCVDELVLQARVDGHHLLGVGIGVATSLASGRARRSVPASEHVHVELPNGANGGRADHVRVGGRLLPVFFDCDATTFGQADVWFGEGGESRCAVMVMVDSCVSAALTMDRAATRMGGDGSMGLGHTVIDYQGRSCTCGSRGCLEAYVGASAILNRYRRATRGRVRHDVDEREAFAALVAAAPRSRAAANVLDEAAGYLDAGIAALINLLDPDRVRIGGWAGHLLGPVVLRETRAVASGQSLRRGQHPTTIELSRLGPDKAALAAATLPIAELLSGGGDRTTQESTGTAPMY